VDVIFLDLAKPFDKILHQRLHKQLNSHRVYRKLFVCIRSWLNNGIQRVVSMARVPLGEIIKSCGVPHGLVLGPILFTLL